MTQLRKDKPLNPKRYQRARLPVTACSSSVAVPACAYINPARVWGTALMWRTAQHATRGWPCRAGPERVSAVARGHRAEGRGILPPRGQATGEECSVLRHLWRRC